MTLRFWTKQRNEFRLAVIVGLLGLTTIALLSLNHVFEGSGAVATAQTPEELQQTYKKAVADAAIAEAREIHRELTAIVPSNSRLVWEGEPGKSRVLVLTWTNYPGYQPEQPMTLSREVWVTPVPELKTFCTANASLGDKLPLRLEQLLGLPPTSVIDPSKVKTLMVTMWVDPADLFRPAPDPEITDSVAGLDFPYGAFSSIPQTYQDWFNNLKAKSYVGDYPFPWTRLGYTYDWGNAQRPIGLSEFVVRPAANVKVQAVMPTTEYCR